jgi:1-hydroxycarotenoid 3,4-desaturase
MAPTALDRRGDYLRCRGHIDQAISYGGYVNHWLCNCGHQFGLYVQSQARAEGICEGACEGDRGLWDIGLYRVFRFRSRALYAQHGAASWALVGAIGRRTIDHFVSSPQNWPEPEKASGLRQAKIIVIGAGMGGLAAASDLARAGHQVTLLERASSPGGKMREVDVAGSKIDGGPTVFTMSWVFEGLFADAGENLYERLDLERAQILARHRWCDANGAISALDLHADIDESVAAISAFAGKVEGQGYRDFCAASRDIYETLRFPFIASQRPNPLSLVSRVGLNRLDALWRTAPHRSLWSALGDYFKDPRLRQLFGRYATYCGSSPFAAPATLMLIAHVEQDGVWRVKGGMARVAEAMSALAQRQGAILRFGAEVSEIIVRNGKANGVILADGTQFEADIIVFNGDMSALGKGLLGKDVMPAAKPVALQNRSQSALTWCVTAKTSGMDLAHHNVFFSNEYRAEFDDVFGARTLPKQASIYVCAQDRGDDLAPPSGKSERLLVLVNAPADGDLRSFDTVEIARAKQSAWALMAACGLQIEETESIATAPDGFNTLFPASGGALYGRANHGLFASFQRPGAQSKLKGLYLAGGSVHPGPGIPMATLSGRLAAEQVLADLASHKL